MGEAKYIYFTCLNYRAIYHSIMSNHSEIEDVDCSFVDFETLKNENRILAEDNQRLREENDRLSEQLEEEKKQWKKVQGLDDPFQKRCLCSREDPSSTVKKKPPDVALGETAEVARLEAELHGSKEALAEERREKELLRQRVAELEAGVLKLDRTINLCRQTQSSETAAKGEEQPAHAARPNASAGMFNRPAPSLPSLSSMKRKRSLSSTDESKHCETDSEGVGHPSGSSNTSTSAYSSSYDDAEVDHPSWSSSTSRDPHGLHVNAKHVVQRLDGDDSDDDIIILPTPSSLKAKGDADALSSVDRDRKKQRSRRLDAEYRSMVERGNRASPAEKKAIFDFMDGARRRDVEVETIVVNEGNERLLVTGHKEPQVVFVEISVELNHVTGKLKVKKPWKPVPRVPPVPPISIKVDSV